MRYLLAFAVVFAFTLFSCSSSEPEVDDSIIVAVDDTTKDTEEETEEETDEDTDTEGSNSDSYVYVDITKNPFYYPSSEIVYSTDENGFVVAEIVDGEKLVFYYYEAADDKVNPDTGQRLADSNYQLMLLFEVDPNLDSFKLEKADFSAASTKFGYDTNTPDRGYFDVTDGIIEGTKISETEWEIVSDFTWTIPEDENHGDIHIEYELSANFIPEPQE